MPYPDGRLYTCVYCKKNFDFSAGFNGPRLIEHLLREHHDDAIYNHGNLYLTDVVKTCFERKGGWGQ